MRRKIFTVLLALMLALTLVAAAEPKTRAAGDSKPPKVWVGVDYYEHVDLVQHPYEAFDDGNGGEVYYTPPAEGETAGTLTLSNFNMVQGSYHWNNDRKEAYAIWADGDLNIVVSGNSVLQPEDFEHTTLYGIRVNGKLTIKNAADSNAKLTVKMTRDPNDKDTVTNAAYGIWCSSTLTVQNNTTGSITVEAIGSDVNTDTSHRGLSYGVYAAQALNVGTGATLIGRGGAVRSNVPGNVTNDASHSVGVTVNAASTISGNVTAKGSYVYAENGKGYSYGIGSWNDAPITINGGTVTATGGTSPGTSCGIYANRALTISGAANITANGGSVTGENGKSCGIECNVGALTKSGSGTLIANGAALTVEKGHSFGIYAHSSSEFSGGTVRVQGGDTTGNNSYSYGIRSEGDMTISAGTFTATGGAAAATSSGVTTSSNHNSALTISGTASVTAYGGTAYSSSGIYCGGELTLSSSGTISAYGGANSSDSDGVEVKKDAKITKGTVKACGGTDSGSSTGFSVGGDADLVGGKVVAVGGGATVAGDTMKKSCGFYTYQTLKVSSLSARLEATGGDLSKSAHSAAESTGVVAYSGATISKGSVVASGGKAAYSTGLETPGASALILVQNGGSLKATGDTGVGDPATSRSYGVRLFANEAELRAEGGTVVAAGGQAPKSAGVYSEQSTSVSCVSGGMLTATGGNTGDSGYTYGIYTIGLVTVDGGSTIVARSGDGVADADALGWGVTCGGVDCAGTLMATGGSFSAGKGSSCALRVTGNGDQKCTVSGGALTATGGTAQNSQGIYSLTDVILTGGKVVAVSNGEGRYSNAIDVRGGTVTAPIILGGSVSDGSNAVLADKCDLSWHYARLDARDYAIGAAVSGATLTWRAKLPAAGGSARMIAAWYDANGKMLGLAVSNRISASGYVPASGTLTVGEGAAQYKLFVVDESYAPLGEAWTAVPAPVELK